MEESDEAMEIKHLNENERRRCTRRLNALLENQHIATAVLATAQGVQIATPEQKSDINTVQLADVSAKIVSISRQIEASSPTSKRNINVCDLAGSPMLVIPVKQVLLATIGRPGSNIGMIASIALDFAQDLATNINWQLDEEESPGDHGFAFDADGFTSRVLEAIKKRHPSPPEEES